MTVLELLISEKNIQEKIKETSIQLLEDYRGKEITIVMIMKSAFVFVADLMRHLPISTTVEFILASSYGSNGFERGALKIDGLHALHLRDRHVLLIDDIYHSGHTLFHIVSELEKHNPLTLKSLVLLFKECSRSLSYLPDYTLFNIPDHFVVGYGMDYKEHYRGLRDIYIYKKPE